MITFKGCFGHDNRVKKVNLLPVVIFRSSVNEGCCACEDRACVCGCIPVSQGFFELLNSYDWKNVGYHAMGRAGTFVGWPNFDVAVRGVSTQRNAVGTNAPQHGIRRFLQVRALVSISLFLSLCTPFLPHDHPPFSFQLLQCSCVLDYRPSPPSQMDTLEVLGC